MSDSTPVPPTQGNVTEPVDLSNWRELNRAWWDERVPHHVASPLYDEAAFRAGACTLRPFELDLLGDVDGLRLVHLQCHFGHDTLSWARRGASVVGLDFSETAVDVANGLAADLGLDGRFVCADVYDAVEALDGEQFDVVYTGFGALNWLPDLEAWGQVVRRLVKPGGRLLLAEFHPFAWVYDEDVDRLTFDYFSSAPFVWDETGSYAGGEAATEHNRTIEHQHTLGEVMSVLLRHGFGIRGFQEYDHTLFPRWPFLEQHADGTFRFPEGQPKLPLMYTLLCDVER